MSSSSGSSQPRDWIWISHIVGIFFTFRTTEEAPIYIPQILYPFIYRWTLNFFPYLVLWIMLLLWTWAEKAMAPYSSTLAWKIPWTEEPRRLQSMGLLRVGHDWTTSLSLFTFMHWRRKWQPTPLFLPGESTEWGSLVGCRLWGHTESETTEVI